jgi:hypothetical protein
MSPWSRWWLKPTRRWVNILPLGAAVALIASRLPFGRRLSFTYGYSTSSALRVPRWTGVYIDWFDLENLAIWCWVWLLVMWTAFALGRWVVVWAYRQPRWQLLIDRPRRRFGSCVFLITLFLAGFRVYSCPHATYVDWWRWIGVSHHRACGNKATAWRPHLIGDWYLFAPL